MEALIDRLPDFAPNGLCSEICAIEPETVIQRLPREEHCVWLPFHGSGQLTLMLGLKWSVSAKAGEVTVMDGSCGDEGTSFSVVSYPKLLDKIGQLWLARQVPELRLPIFLGYEAGWNVEDRRGFGSIEQGQDLLFFCPKEVIVFDENAARSFRDRNQDSLLSNRFKEVVPDFARGVKLQALETKSQYLTRIGRVIEHIRCGDSFQVNLSQGFSASKPTCVRSWAQSAMLEQGSSFGAYWEACGLQLLSLSPERLLHKLSNGDLVTRPIAGTLAKKKNVDDEAVEAFKRHPKELAEHNMLIDLERNDLGRICEPGSVEVEEYLTVETLPHVHHLVSQIRGRLRGEVGLGETIFSMFPGGTITGCPKLETMHIIDEVELGSRGPYTGSLGYFSKGGLDLNILIRSAEVTTERVDFRFGGGLVWDSDPEMEYRETLAKAEGLFESLKRGGAEIGFDHRSL
jgi:anthranilate/para-aminobenzoate synthase component I